MSIREMNEIQRIPISFACYLHWIGWDCIQLGIHICLSMPNIEFHLPFCFVRVGWCQVPIGFKRFAFSSIRDEDEDYE